MAGNEEKNTMHYKLTMLAGVLAVAMFAGDAFAGDAGQLLNDANTMNYEEIQTAKAAKSKAGDNQPLITYAETLKGDHEANQEAVKALTNQKNVKLNTTPEKVDEDVKALDKLNGGAFNAAFLSDEIRDHEKALSEFKTARSQFGEDPDVRLYVDETIPVLEAHLKMAKNLQSQMGTNGNENPANNKNQ
jgi:putative membrane protein